MTSTALGSNWPVQQPRPEQRDSKTPTESSRRQKESDSERPSRHSDSRDGRGRDSSPFRDRSPVRPVRTPLENGDGDSRSSRSNDSHHSNSAVHSHSKRSKDDMGRSNGDRDKAPSPVLSPYARESLAAAAVDKSVPPLVSNHPSRYRSTNYLLFLLLRAKKCIPLNVHSLPSFQDVPVLVSLKHSHFRSLGRFSRVSWSRTQDGP